MPTVLTSFTQMIIVVKLFAQMTTVLNKFTKSFTSKSKFPMQTNLRAIFLILHTNKAIVLKKLSEQKPITFQTSKLDSTCLPSHDHAALWHCPTAIPSKCLYV